MNAPYVTSDNPDDLAGAHHGTPDLTNRDITLLHHFRVWIDTVRAVKPKYEGHYGPQWLPGPIDILKSRLFWRIRSGKKPLDFPPPTCYSCPWYEVVEISDYAHSIGEENRETSGNRLVVAQDCYDILEKHDNYWIVSFGPYKFKAWNADVKWTGLGGHPDMYRPGGWVQIIKE